MNGQHLKQLPEEEAAAMAGQHLVACGLLASADSAFAKAAVKLVSKSMVSAGKVGGGAGGGADTEGRECSECTARVHP